ncbi:serine/threonine protein phosphatase [Longispora sp. K20-0274]|uniref:serine/threonine protein phosphatase n=1 Tax=Longispora sp. K20-0274 TaxID=3088255 RepID=UPI003999C0D3
MNSTGYDGRVARHGEVSTALALLGDRQLGELVAGAPRAGAGIGGTSAVLEVDGVPVFVKRVPLTDRELSPDGSRSTANLFGLPLSCQYGAGGPGFGAWRELAANVMTTNWVLTGRSGAFPLLYHWRVLPGGLPVPDEHADVDNVVARYGGSPAVRDRLEALAKASASLVLFSEHVPHNLADWLRATDDVPAACALLEQMLPAVTAMNEGGLLHFDAHFRNLLTDGRRLYVADLGLATSPRFELSAAERDFVAHNAGHDAAYAVMLLVNWLVIRVCGVPVTVERNAYVRRCAAGTAPVGVPESVSALVMRYAPVAAVMNDFYWEVFGGKPDTPFPAAEVARAFAGATD